MFRHCPGCGVATQKKGGCNHMTCRCGAEWCSVCGELGEDAQAVYAHMFQRHGGWFGVGGGGGGENDEYNNGLEDDGYYHRYRRHARPHPNPGDEHDEWFNA
ncbi:hypothetical protein PG994_006245 [Apiospora phragmitis]|uniref:RING-type domain-containing protein n=1 Tax=Apiospora phragmitis TaxID=2905665 RepID=A0ABR1VEI0_9PEZI